MSAYDKMAKQSSYKKDRKSSSGLKINPLNNASRISQRSDVGGNIFMNQTSEYLQEDFQRNSTLKSNNQSFRKKPAHAKRRSNKRSSEIRIQSRQELGDDMDQRVGYQDTSNTNQLNLVDDTLVHQGSGGQSEYQSGDQQDDNKISVFGSLLYYLGEITSNTSYPCSRVIYVDNNNEVENKENRKQAKKKKVQLGTNSHSSSEQTEQYFSENELKMKTAFVLLRVLGKVVWGHWEGYLYITVVIISFLVQKVTFMGNAQYIGDPVILVIMLVIALVLRFIVEFLIVRKRKDFKENKGKYLVYSHNGQSAQWNRLSAVQIKPGNVYKIFPNQVFPTDCILLHSPQSLIRVNQERIINRLSQQVSTCSLKQTVIKTDTIILPISGMASYRISTAEPRGSWIEGKLTLQEPIQITHNITQENIVLRGSVNSSGTELLCMSLQVGNSSFILKNAQYPRLFRDNLGLTHDNPNSSGLQTTPPSIPVDYMLENFTYFAVVLYSILSGIGILVGFLTNSIAYSHFYLGDQINISYIAFYHFMNFVILLPVWAKLAISCYVLIMGKSIQSTISKRMFEMSSSSQNEINKAGTSHNHQFYQKRYEAIGKVNIKDYSILPYLKNEHAIITTIDMFRSSKTCFKLRHIKVKDIRFEIGKDHMQSQIFSEEHKQLLKYIMCVSVLTLNKAKVKNLADQQHQKDLSYTRYEKEILRSAKKDFGLKLNAESKNLYSVSGPIESIFTGGQLDVIPVFTIPHSLEVPYSIHFYEIPIPGQKKPKQNIVLDLDEDDEDQDKEKDKKSQQSIQSKQILSTQQKRMLCIIRGDPTTIITKAYSQRINLLEEAERLHQDDGYMVQFVGKFTMYEKDVEKIKQEYLSSSAQKGNFYVTLEKFFSYIEPMGLLVFENQFKQPTFTSNPKNNPILNLGSVQTIEPSSSSANYFSSQKDLPLTIIIVPKPEPNCMHSELQSISNITNLLTNEYLFNFPAGQIGEKFLHDPIEPFEMIEQLKRQRVLCWNSWTEADISFMINSLKEWNLPVISYLEKDEFTYLTKACDYSIGRNTQAKGYDIGKYTDIQIMQREDTPKTLGFLTIMQLLKYDSQTIHEGMYYVLLIHILKFICYFTVECINIAYTLGTGISIVRLPLYLVTEIVVFMDIFYYLNLGDRNRYARDKLYTRKNILQESLKILVIVFLGTLLIIYTSVESVFPDGTPTPAIFVVLQIHLMLTTILIFCKLSWTQDFSLYKILIVLSQILIYYIGIFIVSLSSLYEFKGAIYYTFDNKLYFVGVIVVWILLMIDYGRLVVSVDFRINKKGTDQNKYKNIKRLDKQNALDAIVYQY